VNKIVIEIIPHDQHRYSTVGDYWRDADGTLQIRISDMGNPTYEMLVLLHELFELHWAETRGVPFDAIDAFDKTYEAARDPSDTSSEPGDSKDAPYYEGHQMATALERVAATFYGVDWNDYDGCVGALP
jgi:hypothetical protein